MNYYETMGVDRGAEPEVIDAAYRAMMRRYHPDRFDGSKDEAERRSKDLNEAYAVLRDPEKRRAYDATLAPAFRAHQGTAPALSNPASAPRRGSRRAVPLVALGLAGLAAAYAFPGGTSRPPRTQAIAPDVVTPTPRPTVSASPSLAPTPAASPTDTAKAECTGVACRVLTPFGWGGIEAGVTVDSAQHATGLQLRDDGHYTDAGDGSCLAYQVVGGPRNLRMLVEGGVITTVEVHAAPSQPVFRTDTGIRLGDPEAAVRAAYKSLKQLPDIYSEPPDKKLFHYEPGGERGIKFDIVGGKVAGISVGTTSIEYVEGCL
ncbi:DnaJ domain-containing protein [Sphingomonas sp. S2-65]|uniref:DnaJ domain-containing protein n=1 Tax=Sphingomonas sp. S2-65 TaxID=2903960 RepID=UPI001F30BE95|nr:DnaJ domain-containing protein [Sphingomonas sp. S2-65]UYY57994.1 DnaJ domain-containing protein [Sphingomonas sp. S2-65]